MRMHGSPYYTDLQEGCKIRVFCVIVISECPSRVAMHDNGSVGRPYVEVVDKDRTAQVIM
jgi:hypothetical protein